MSPSAIEGPADSRPAKGGRSTDGSEHRESVPPDKLDDTATIAARTLLVLDIVDSTRLVEALGDARAVAVLARHDRMARDLVARHGGREIDKTDGFLLLFRRPLDAVACTLAYHRELARLSEEVGVTIKARAGLHAGEVFLYQNPPEDVARGAKPLEVEGLAKLVAARTMSLAQGGQTLLTQQVFDLVEPDELEARGGEISWRPHGVYRFKGVRAAHPVFEIGEAGVAPFSHPPDTPKAYHLRRRLLRIFAVLALLVAGGFLVYLASVAANPRRPSVAVLGFKNGSGQEDAAWLSTALAELLATDLAAGGEVRVIPGESIARMELELELPETDSFGAQTLEAIGRNLGADYVVVGSFLVLEPRGERRLSIQPILQSTGRRETVTAFPASGREAELLDLVARIGAGVRQELGVVTSAPAEQMQATLPVNTEAARFYFEGLRKLRRFDARGAKESLERAIAIDPDYALAYAALSQAWAELGYDAEAEASAQRASELAEGLPRHTELLIRARAFEAAARLPEAIEVYRTLWNYHDDNVDYGLRLAETQRAAGRLDEALATVEALRELPEPLRHDPRIDLVEAQAAHRLSDYRRELAAAERALVKGEEQSARLIEAEARWRQGTALEVLGEHQRAAATLEESLRLFRAVGHQSKAAQVLNIYASLRYEQGDRATAEELYREALAIHRQTGNRKWVSTLLNNLAVLTQVRGDLATAREMLEESLAIARAIGARPREAVRLNALGWVLLEQGDLEGARAMAADTFAVSRETGSREDLAWAHLLHGRIAAAAGELEEARERYGVALTISREIANAHLEGQSLAARGELLLARGELEAAGDSLAAAAAVQEELGERGFLARTRRVRAMLALEQGEAREAESLARNALGELEREARENDRLMAAATLGRALLAQEQLAAARELLAAAREAAERSQSPAARLAVALAAGRAEAAAGDPAAALALLRSARDEAAALGLAALELEARLARGEVAAGAGRPGAGAALATLAEEARARGFGLIARRAERLAAGLAQAAVEAGRQLPHVGLAQHRVVIAGHRHHLELAAHQPPPPLGELAAVLAVR